MAIDTSVRPTVREPVLSTGHVTMSKLHSHNRRKSNKLSVVEAIQPVPVSPLKMQQLGLGQGQGKGALLPTVAVADDAEPMTASQLLGLDGDVDLLLSPELDLLADLDELAYEYVMDPEPWEMFVDAELNRLTYYAPMPLSPASPALSRSSGRSSSAGCSLAGADSDLDSDSDDPSSPTDEQPGALAAYWESVASTAAFTAPRIHICHVLQHYLASCASDPVLAAATAAAALDQGYADLLLPGPRNGRARTAELKTGRRMAGYLWALWTMVVELARKGADQDVLALLLHKLRRLPGRSFAQWKDPAEGGKCPEAAATTSDAKGVQMPAFRSVRAWRELARLEEVVHRAWQCSARECLFFSSRLPQLLSPVPCSPCQHRCRHGLLRHALHRRHHRMGQLHHLRRPPFRRRLPGRLGPRRLGARQRARRRSVGPAAAARLTRGRLQHPRGRRLRRGRRARPAGGVRARRRRAGVGELDPVGRRLRRARRLGTRGHAAGSVRTREDVGAAGGGGGDAAEAVGAGAADAVRGGVYARSSRSCGGVLFVPLLLFSPLDDPVWPMSFLLSFSLPSLSSFLVRKKDFLADTYVHGSCRGVRGQEEAGVGGGLWHTITISYGIQWFYPGTFRSC